MTTDEIAYRTPFQDAWARVLAASPAAPVAEQGQGDDNLGAKLHGTMDAQVWATEFCRLNNAADYGMMLAWFANAIMAGYDHAKREAPPATGEGQQQDEPWLSEFERKSLNRILSAAGVCMHEKSSNGNAMAAFWSLAGTIANMLESRASLSSPAERQEAEEPQIELDSIEQYRQQMAGICTAAFGYWKEGDSIHPDFDTPALRDVAKLYAKYAALHEAARLAAPSSPSVEIGTVDTPEFRDAFYNILGSEYFSAVRDIDQHTAQAVKAEREKAQQWISVDERLPNDGETVLIYVPSCTYQKIGFDTWQMHHEAPVSFSSATVETGLMWDEHDFQEVTHWMPFPAAPQPAADTEQGAK